MITRSDFDNILREYDELQLREAKNVQARKAEAYRRIPTLSEIDEDIAREAVSCAVAKIHGQAEEAMQREAILKILKEQKASLLNENGYTAAEFEPRPVCPKCKDTGYVGGKKCSCMQKKITDILYDQSNIRDILREENFENFSLDCYPETPIPGTDMSPRQIAEKAAASARDFIANFDTSCDNLFITGAAGTGKTFLSNCIAKELLDKGYFVFYISAVRLFELLASYSFRDRGRTDSSKTDLGSNIINKQIFDCDLLIIDDLGTEVINTFTLSRLFNCINERLLSKKHTIISTNLSLQQLQGNYSERIFSRIANNYTMIKLYGDDIRMKKKLEAM